MNKELFRHVMCAETIRQEFTGHRVVVTDTVFDGDKLSVGRVVGILADGEYTPYEIERVPENADLRLAFPGMPIILNAERKTLGDD
ncbi:MAG: hypothetical protein K2N63_13375 [Lachnospiraceae bacterium]|nr:hypothetical protein [Lachnospiraceae bacterium]